MPSQNTKITLRTTQFDLQMPHSIDTALTQCTYSADTALTALTQHVTQLSYSAGTALTQPDTALTQR